MIIIMIIIMIKIGELSSIFKILLIIRIKRKRNFLFNLFKFIK